ncbi:hypothetical protein NTGZN8_80004 [Candidatus Nitrotoga fabula]|uniref:Uncharacterized protein n=1 Tax=Candidatus Nitrotoga fabula TaxID=2182327 RepID=A0A916FBR7_9PROT|nr:hypothetical protein NTGZN8_80004 [Candidatus Nitrotoga fabula]
MSNEHITTVTGIKVSEAMNIAVIVQPLGNRNLNVKAPAVGAFTVDLGK